MKPLRVFLAVFLFSVILNTAAPSCFAAKEEKDEKKQPKSQGSQLYLQRSDTLNVTGLGIEELPKANPYDPNRVTEVSEKKDFKRTHALRTTSQRPSDYLEDTPLGVAT